MHACPTLTRFTNSAAADALIGVLKTADDYVAQIARDALHNLHESDRAARAWLPGLTNADAAIRSQTIRPVSWTDSQLAFPALCARLQDVTNSVRYAAAEALGRLSDPRAFAVLTKWQWGRGENSTNQFAL